MRNLDETEAIRNARPVEGEEIEQRRVWNIYLSRLHRRVLQVLRGHMVWICAKAECSELESFYPHHWPNGRRIFYTQWLSPPSLIDTPLQLLKVFCYYKLAKSLPQRIWKRWNRARELYWIQKSLRPKARSWIDKLHRLNERGTYAFYDPGSMDDDDEQDRKYRLSDHVVIGLALKAVEELKLQTNYRIWPYYTYEEVHCKILKRFTVEHPISKQKMLAISRWKDATRFLLHSKDTLLFSTESLEYLQDRVMWDRKQKNSEHAGSIDLWRYADRR
jgi:hypothetical protein